MSNVSWERRHEAFRAIHDKIAEVLAKLDQPTDPQTTEIVASIVLSVMMTKTGTLEDFDLAASGEIVGAPGTGKKIRLLWAFFCLDGDEFAYFRFGASGKMIFPTRVKGAFGGNLVGGYLEGGEDEALNAVKSGSNNMTGFVVYEVVST